MRAAENASWIALKLVRGVGNVVYRALLERFGEPAAVLAARSEDLVGAGVRAEVARAIAGFDGWALAEAEIRRLRHRGAHLVTWNDSSYPPRLREIHDPPPFLYVAGELQAGDELAVAVVGSRKPSVYGREMARALCGRLARLGLVVVSGLARGIDAEAHRSALRCGGRTIAVLGSGIDVVYPPEHHALFRDIAMHGAVLSEFPLGTKPEGENFPNRNRIISGVALGTVVVEATERSGSLITAQWAADHGREVFAVPGPVGPRSRGPHQLIKQGAKLTESAEDIVEEIGPQILASARRREETAAAAAPGHLSTALEQELAGYLSERPLHVDEIAARARVSAPEVLAALLALELRGAVRQLPGKYFVSVAGISAGLGD